MDNNVMERYVNFITGEIKGEYKTLLWIPTSIKNEIYIPKIGPKIFIDVKVEILEKYTRSCKIKLLFDKYEIEDIFFMSRHKSPDLLLREIDNKIEKIVNNTYLGDNRLDEITQKYEECKSNLPKFLIK